MIRFFFLCLLLCMGIFSHAHASKENLKNINLHTREVWVGGWYDWNPYQYLKNKDDPTSLTGLDIAFTKLLLNKLGKKYEITEVSWKQHQEDLKKGKRDFAVGAFETEERKKFTYISKAYREEENSFFILKEKAHNHKYSNLDDFLDYIKKNKIKIAVVDGYSFADKKLNDYISDPKNKKLIIKTKTDNESMRLTLSEDVDGFLSDRIVGATIMWKEGITKKFVEKYLNVKADLHILLSKETMSEDELKIINQAIDEVKNSDDYSKLISWYFYPIILMQTTDADWFFALEIIGMVAFAISGLILAARINTTLLGAFLLAFIPSVGGGIIRDVTFGRYPIWIVQNKSYMMMLMLVVAIGFIFTKVHERFFKGGSEKLHALSDHIIVIADAAGLAVFTVTGVMVSMIVKTDPLWFWGPFFAMLTGAGGGMIRDIIVKNKHVDLLYGEIYAELAVIWGGLLSIYLTMTVNDTRSERIIHAVIVTVIGCFLSRLTLHYLKVSNLKFGKEK